MPSIERREFLRHAVTATAALTGLSTPWAAQLAQAIEPLKRNGGPFFKYSLAAYSFRDFLEKKSGEYTLADFVRTCADLQLEGTELTSYYFPKEITTDYLRDLKRQCFELGLDVSGTAVGNDFCVPAGAKRDAEIADVKRWIDYAEILGAPVIRIFSGSAKSGQSPEVAHRLAVEAMEECCDYAGQHGVCLALENHGGLTDTVDGMLALVRDVKSPWFGVNMDTGNFHTADPYADLAKIAPYTVNVQVKVSMHPAGSRAPADLARLANIVKDAGYRGYVVLEFEEREDPRKGVPRWTAEMKRAFSAALA